MKRAPLVALGTVGGIAGVLLLNPQGVTPATVADAAVTTLDDSAATGTQPVDAQAPATAPTATPTPTSDATGATNAASVSGTVTGDAVFVRYGNVQVKVTVKKGTITKVVAVDLPTGDGRSSEISRQVAPMLAQQALTAQSASIDGVSGATFTSYGYQQSLQSALDKLGL